MVTKDVNVNVYVQNVYYMYVYKCTCKYQLTYGTVHLGDQSPPLKLSQVGDFSLVKTNFDIKIHFFVFFIENILHGNLSKRNILPTNLTI